MHRSLHSTQPRIQHVLLPQRCVCPKVKASRDPLRPWIVRAASDDDGPGNRIKSTLQSLDGLLSPPDISTTETVEVAKPDRYCVHKHAAHQPQRLWHECRSMNACSLCSVPEPTKQTQEVSGPGWNVKKIPQPDGTFKVVTSYDLPLVSNVAATLLAGSLWAISLRSCLMSCRHSHGCPMPCCCSCLPFMGQALPSPCLTAVQPPTTFFLKLALMKPKVIDGEYYRCANSVLHADPGHAPYCNGVVSLGS